MQAEPILADLMTRGVKTMREEQALLEALEFLHEHRVRHLPVVNADGKLVGVVTDRDIKRATPTAMLREQRELWEQVVRDTTLGKIMTRNPTTIASTARFSEALRLFVDEKIGCLPVVDDSELVGILTAQDLFRAMLQMLDGEGS